MRTIIALVALLAAVPQAASAPPALPDGCFCLRHVATAQILTGCSGYKPPSGHYGRARCTNADGRSSDVLVTEEWAVVADGKPDCDPCQPKKREPVEVPRRKE